MERPGSGTSSQWPMGTKGTCRYKAGSLQKEMGKPHTDTSARVGASVPGGQCSRQVPPPRSLPKGPPTSSSNPEDHSLTCSARHAAEATERVTDRQRPPPPPSWPAAATPDGLCQLGHALGQPRGSSSAFPSVNPELGGAASSCEALQGGHTGQRASDMNYVASGTRNGA